MIIIDVLNNEIEDDEVQRSTKKPSKEEIDRENKRKAMIDAYRRGLVPMLDLEIVK